MLPLVSYITSVTVLLLLLTPSIAFLFFWLNLTEKQPLFIENKLWNGKHDLVRPLKPQLIVAFSKYHLKKKPSPYIKQSYQVIGSCSQIRTANRPQFQNGANRCAFGGKPEGRIICVSTKHLTCWSRVQEKQILDDIPLTGWWAASGVSFVWGLVFVIRSKSKEVVAAALRWRSEAPITRKFSSKWREVRQRIKTN